MHRLRPAVGSLQHVIPPALRPASARSYSAAAVGSSERHHSLDRSNPKHILRHLLRECSYLPDPLARIYLRGHVLQRFRAYIPHGNARSGCSQAPSRVLAKLRDARRAITYLRKANVGRLPHLKKILDLTYGRTGRRSRELLQPLKISAPHARDDGGKDPSRKDLVTRTLVSRPTALPVAVADKIPHLSFAIEKLYVEQQRRSKALGNSRQITKAAGPDIPLENVWRRPLSPSRVKNKVKKWYASVLGKILPPLPQPVWEDLEQRIQAGSAESANQARRCRRTMVGAVSAPAVGLERLEAELSTVHRPRPVYPGGHQQPHRVTARFMRRRWKEVLESSPQLRHGEKSEQLQVLWPERKRFAKTTDLSSSLRAALNEDF